MGDQIFKVLTEFRFDIGKALVNSEKLQGAVNNISSAADNALLSFQSLGAGIVGQMSLANFGLLEFLKKSIDASDSYNQSVTGFAALMSSNMNFLTGTIGTFNDRLGTSKSILEDINAVAGKFGIAGGDLAKVTLKTSSALIPAGAAGAGLGNAINLSRLAITGTQGLGFKPGDLANELHKVLTGKQVDGGLFSVLTGSTKAFKDFKDDADSFTKLDVRSRMRLLTTGLKEMTEIMKGAADADLTLSGTIEHFKDLFDGMNSILKPIGDAILPPLLKLLKEFHTQLDTIGRDIGKQIGAILGPLLEDPKKFVLGLLQLKHLGNDFKTSGKIFEIVGLVEIVLKALKFLGIGSGFTLGGLVFSGLKAAFSGIGRGIITAFRALFDIEGTVKVMRFLDSTAGVAMFGVRALGFVLRDVLFPLAFITTAFQIISRAIELAKIKDAAALFKIMPKVLDILHHIELAFENLLRPITNMVDIFAELISPIFEMSTYLDGVLPLLQLFADIMEVLGTAVVLAAASLNGFFRAIAEFLADIKNGDFLSGFKNLGGAFNRGVDEYIANNLKSVDQGKNVQNMVTNIGKVEIRNDFKENQQPDRIAFTLKEQLLKTAQNPTQARGMPLQGGTMRRSGG